MASGSKVDDCAIAETLLVAMQYAGGASELVVRYFESVATSRGLAAALNSGDPAFKALSAT